MEAGSDSYRRHMECRSHNIITEVRMKNLSRQSKSKETSLSKPNANSTIRKGPLKCATRHVNYHPASLLKVVFNDHSTNCYIIFVYLLKLTKNEYEKIITSRPNGRSLWIYDNNKRD